MAQACCLQVPPHLEVPDLLPAPHLRVRHQARRPPHVLLPGRVYQHHVELGAKGGGREGQLMQVRLGSMRSQSAWWEVWAGGRRLQHKAACAGCLELPWGCGRCQCHGQAAAVGLVQIMWRKAPGAPHAAAAQLPWHPTPTRHVLAPACAAPLTHHHTQQALAHTSTY